MRNTTLAVLGDVPVTALDCVASQFGCVIVSVDSFEHLEKIYVPGNLAAVLFEPHAFKLSWEIALKSVLDAAPTALPIVCHGFSEPIDWPSLAAAGAFHTLAFPFDRTEVMQSLGFVWAARHRAAKTVEMGSV